MGDHGLLFHCPGVDNRVLSMQLQATLKVVFSDAVPVFGGLMIIIAVWSLLVSRVRASSFLPANLHVQLCFVRAGSELPECIGHCRGCA